MVILKCIKVLYKIIISVPQFKYDKVVGTPNLRGSLEFSPISLPPSPALSDVRFQYRFVDTNIAYRTKTYPALA
jgi:hypothetical protein